MTVYWPRLLLLSLMRMTFVIIKLLLTLFCFSTSSDQNTPHRLCIIPAPIDVFSLTQHTAASSSVHRNTDKMSDEEKLPIALAGLLFISLPFVAGLIALYAAK